MRADGVRVVWPGKFVVHVGSGQPLVDKKFHTSNILAATVQVAGVGVEVDRCSTRWCVLLTPVDRLTRQRRSAAVPACAATVIIFVCCVVVVSR